MRTLTALIAFLAVALPAAAQGEEPRRPPKPPPGERPGGEEELRALEAQIARLQAERRAIEEKMAHVNTPEERAEVQRAMDEATARLADAERRRADIGRMRRPPGEMGGDPEIAEMEAMIRAAEDELAKLEEKQRSLRTNGDEKGAENAARVAEETRAKLAALHAKRRLLDEARGRPGGPGMGPKPMRDRVVTAEDIDRAMAFLKETEPRHYEKMADLRKSSLEEFKKAITGLAMEVRDLEMLRKSDPPRYERRMGIRKLEHRSKELAEKVRSAKQEDEKASAKKDLRGVLGELFDLREAEKEDEIRRLEDELGRLRDTMKKRQEAKEKIVDRRVEELTGEEDDLGW